VKKKATVFVVVTVLVAVIGIGIGAYVSITGSHSMPREVESFNSNQQVSGRVTYTNYSVVLKSDVDWNTLPTDRKIAVIDYAFSEARDRAAENGVSNYNISGAQDGVPLFLYDREHDEVMIFQDGIPASKMAAPRSRYE